MHVKRHSVLPQQSHANNIQEKISDIFTIMMLISKANNVCQMVRVREVLLLLLNVTVSITTLLFNNGLQYALDQLDRRYV